MVKNRDRYTLLLCKLSAHNVPIIACKIQNVINLSWHVTLSVDSALHFKKLGVSSDKQGENSVTTTDVC